jgi:hypothetical protein
MKKKRDLPDDVREALELVEGIEDTVERAMEQDRRGAGTDFLEDILDHAKSVGENIDRTQHVTAPQLRALNNWMAAARRWVHDD